jgi:glycosyltransferase involved in cell wall biosynthesis/lipopolysaccharide/colanic/teichoic acid biosynthesis glycosyltransferase
LKGQAAHLHARGYDVHAISSPGPLADAYEKSEPVTVHRVPMTRTMTPLLDLVALIQLVRTIGRLRPAVVHAGTPKGGLLGVLAAWLLRVPVRIYHVRGLPIMTATGLRRRVLWLTERLACAAATHVLCVSQSMRGILDAEGICSLADSSVLLDGSSNGVDAGRFSETAIGNRGAEVRARLGIPADARVIGFVGRLVREKGVVELMEAWRRLRAAHQDLHMLVVGPFERGDELPAEVRVALEQDRRIHLTGLEWDTPSFYAAMDVFCLPSYREGFPNVVLEAASLSLPVVANRIPGIVDAVKDGVTGTLVTTQSVDELEQALAAYVSSRELRASHGGAGREWVLRSFAQERIWEALDAYYRAATARRVLHVVTVPMTLQFMAGQAAFMGRRNIALSFVSSAGPEQGAFAQQEKVSVHSVEMSRRITPSRDLVSLLRLFRLLRRTRPEIVHAHTPKAGLVTMVAATLARVPVRIYQLHGLTYETATGTKRRVQVAAERLACALATRVLSVSDSVRSRVIADGVCEEDKVAVIAAGSIGGIDAELAFNPERQPEARGRIRESLGIGPDVPVVGFVGRLTRDKGIETLWQAWLQLREQLPSAHLVLIGSTDFARRDQSVSDAVMAGLAGDPRVHVVGAIAHHELPRFYAAMDVLCLPTYREGFPVTILEAAAMALPCVASRVTGCVDAVVAGETGELVAPGDAASLSAALMAYVNDAQLRSSHGRAARARVRAEFSPERVWDALQREYASLAGWQAAPVRRSAQREGRMSAYRDTWKRGLDVTVAGITAPVWVPLLALTALLVRARLGGPVLFRQQRPGLGGRAFTMVKFRTMTDARDAQGRLLPDAERLTAFGRFLRASSLDELPELWNVLKGDMSLVGPRPLLMQYLDRYTPAQARRHEVRPGITGFAQVNGRNALGWEEKFALDVHYVDHQSLWLDVKILALTVWNVVSRDGISQPGQATAQEFMGSISR